MCVTLHIMGWGSTVPKTERRKEQAEHPYLLFFSVCSRNFLSLLSDTRITGRKPSPPGIYVLGIQTLVLTLGWQPQNHCFNTKNGRIYKYYKNWSGTRQESNWKTGYSLQTHNSVIDYQQEYLVYSTMIVKLKKNNLQIIYQAVLHTLCVYI